MQFFVAGCMRAAAGTNEAQQADSGNSGDSHGRNHTHSHGHHGGSNSGKDKPAGDAGRRRQPLGLVGRGSTAASSSVRVHSSHRGHRPPHWSRRFLVALLVYTYNTRIMFVSRLRLQVISLVYIYV